MKNLGTGKLNIWVSEIQQPCLISNRTWWFTVFDCKGRPFKWCDREYTAVPGKCGHIEFELPPGMYKIFAHGHPRYVYEDRGVIIKYNIFTDDAIVKINCEETTCVTLYPPSYHRCGYYFLVATLLNMHFSSIDEKKGHNLMRAIHEVLEELPKPIQENETLEFLEKYLKEIAVTDDDYKQVHELYSQFKQESK